MAAWIMGIFMAIISLVGLVMASGANDATFSWVGICTFVFGVAFCYAQIVRNT